MALFVVVDMPVCKAVDMALYVVVDLALYMTWHCSW